MGALVLMGPPHPSGASIGPAYDFASPPRSSRPKRNAIKFFKRMLGFKKDDAKNHGGWLFSASSPPPRLGESFGLANERTRAEFDDEGFEEVSDDDELMEPHTAAPTESDWCCLDHTTVNNEIIRDCESDEELVASIDTIVHSPGHPETEIWPVQNQARSNSAHQYARPRTPDDLDFCFERIRDCRFDASTYSFTAASSEDDASARTVVLSSSDMRYRERPTSIDADMMRESETQLNLPGGFKRVTGASIFMPPAPDDTPSDSDDTDLVTDSWLFLSFEDMISDNANPRRIGRRWTEDYDFL